MSKNTLDTVFLAALVLFIGLFAFLLRGKALARDYAPEGSLEAAASATSCQYVGCGQSASGVHELWFEAGTGRGSRRGNIYVAQGNFSLCAVHARMAASKKWPLRGWRWGLALGVLALYSVPLGLVAAVVLVYLPLRGLVPKAPEKKPTPSRVG